MKYFASSSPNRNKPAPSRQRSASDPSSAQAANRLSTVRPPNDAGTGRPDARSSSSHSTQVLTNHAVLGGNPCLVTTKTPLNYAHGPRRTHQDGPLYGYEAHASLLRAKLAAYIADLKRLAYEWDDATGRMDRARRELNLLDGDERRSRTFSAEQRAWEKEREGWLADFGWAEGRVRRVKGEVGRKGYRGFGDEAVEEEEQRGVGN
ncbi:hypothetical protein LTR86_000202 [Recurvomyces mirabilis]|nr:hypothetical protein LTR86_000202 [Recurvomyces mirabilis]